jgi:hypothetical protein
MSDRTVDAIKAKISLDSSDLGKANAAAAATAAAFKDHVGGAATTHTLRFKESLTTLTEHVAKMPPIVGQTARSLESMASNASSIGPIGMAAMGAAAGLGILVEGAKMADEAFTSAAKKTEDYMRVTGQSADASSRQVEVFGNLGVGADVATAAMVKLEKAIGAAHPKLAAYGIEVGHNAKGEVDMGVTLGNVADAYKAATDPVQKMEIVLTAFGKSGAAMIPVLEQGSAKLKEMEAAAKVVMTDADIEKARKYAIQQKEINANWDAMMASMGRVVDGMKGGIGNEYLKQDFITQKLAESNLSLSHATGATQTRVSELTREYGKQFDAAQNAKASIDATAQSLKDAAAASEAATAAFDKFVGAEEAATHADIALQRENIKVAESQGKVDLAQENLNKQIQQFGPTSDEAVLAGHQLTLAQLDQKDAYYAAAAAAKKLQEDTDVAATGQKNASKDAQAYIDKLTAEAATLAPGSPLRANLQTYIDKLNNELPKVVTTELKLNTGAARQELTAYRNLIGLNTTDSLSGGPRAAGGPVVPGGIYDIGERGPEKLVMGATGGYVIPNAGATNTDTNRLTLPEARDMVALLASIDRKLSSSPSFNTTAYGRS